MRKVIFTSVVTWVLLFTHQQLKAQKTAPKYSIQLLGDANSFKTLTESGSTPANASVGLLYTKYFKAEGKEANARTFHSAEIALNYNLASTVDTIKATYNNGTISSRSDFGSSILLPGNSGQSTFFSAKVYFGKVDEKGKQIKYHDYYKCISGFYANFNHASRNWMDSGRNVKASTIAISLGAFYDFIDYEARDNMTDFKKKKSAYIGLGYTGRWIVGDIALNENDKFRTNVLGNNQTSFHGIEFLLGAKLENARIELRIPIFFGNHQIAGLSGTQPNYQIGFTGGVTIK